MDKIGSVSMQDCPDVHVIFLFPPKEISSETGSKLRECASILGTEYPLIPVIAQVSFAFYKFRTDLCSLIENEDSVGLDKKA